MLDIFRTLPGVFDGIDIDHSIHESLIFTVWRHVAGELLSEHTVPLRLEGSILVVAVSSTTWKAHLEELCPQMLYKLSTVLGPSVVTYIDLVIDENTVLAKRGPVEDPQAAEKARRRAKKAVPADLRAAADAITDDALRDKFLLAAGSCLVRKGK